MKHSFLSKLFKNKVEKDEAETTEALTFVVTDAVSQDEASKILVRYKIPTPAFHSLEKAYVFGDGLRRKLKKNEIHVVKKNLTKEEAYQLNVGVYNRLLEQRNAIIGIIENILHPLIKDVAGVKIGHGELEERIRDLEKQKADQDRQIKELQNLFSGVHGKLPQDAQPFHIKKEWKLPLKDAALKIISIYKEDEISAERKYFQVRQVSDEFYDQYDFVYKRRLDKEQLYKNVMQYWKDLK